MLLYMYACEECMPCCCVLLCMYTCNIHTLPSKTLYIPSTCVPLLLVALAFRAQLVEEVPVADNDQRVDVLVTADGVLECSKQ